mgnify:CR=1 FL=1
MDHYQRQKLLVQVAKLYYEQNCSQEEISKLLKLSRPYISKLLNAARQEGIVQIQIVDSFNTETKLEKLFRERFQLEKAIILPRGRDGNALKQVGEAAARYLNEILEDGMVIGTSWGGTLYECSNFLVQRKDMSNIVYIQLCGGISNINKTVYAAEIANNFAEALGGTAYLMQVPAVVENKEIKSLFWKDRSMAQIIEYGKKIDIAIFTAGTFGEKNALVKAGYLEKERMKSLEKKGAVGDICSHVIDFNGKICDQELDERTLAISLETMKKARYRIAVAQGESKVASLCGALNGKLMNVLVTNEETAQSIWDRFEKR